MKQILLLFFVFLMTQTHAQFARVDIPGTEVRKLKSTIVQGEEYALHIMFPRGYENSRKKYPVVYLMDSQWDFPLVQAIYGQQYFDGFVPELLLVGVTWGGTHPNPDSLRGRDYTPTHEPPYQQSGGADQFLSFFRKELFPFIEKNYKASSENRTLMGCSLGGLLTLYTLFTQPDLFSGYIAASPAVGWNKEVIYNFEKNFAAKTRKPVRLYLTVGEVEGSRPSFEKFAAHLSSRRNPHFTMQSKVLENTGHSGTKSETYSRGLQYIFERPKLKLADSTLNAYAGSYQFENGAKLFVKNETGRLVISDNPTSGFPFYAATDSTFYTDREYLTIQFKKEAGTITGLELQRFGGQQTLKKIKD